MHRLFVEGKIGTDVARLADRLIDHLETTTTAELGRRSRRLGPARVLPLHR